MWHCRHSWEFGGRDPPILGWGSWNLREILLYAIMYRNMRWEHFFPKWWLSRNIKICCILDIKFRDEKVNPVLRSSVCWTFRTHDPQFSSSEPRPLSFQNQLTLGNKHSFKYHMSQGALQNRCIHASTNIHTHTYTDKSIRTTCTCTLTWRAHTIMYNDDFIGH